MILLLLTYVQYTENAEWKILQIKLTYLYYTEEKYVSQRHGQAKMNEKTWAPTPPHTYLAQRSTVITKAVPLG
jgi:hypothetical protein